MAEIVYPRPTVFCSSEELKLSYNWFQQFGFSFLAIFEMGIVRSKSERMGITPLVACLCRHEVEMLSFILLYQERQSDGAHR